MKQKIHIAICLGWILAIASKALWAAPVDDYWAGWRGPADGTVCVKAAPGPSLDLSWTLNLLDPNNDGNTADALGYSQNLDQVFHGSHIRADANWIYLKITTDYTPVANPTIHRIDPDTGTVNWGSTPANAQDTSTPRAFQLYQSPQGFNALNVSAFYGSNWDTLNLDTLGTQNQFFHSHSNIGTRIIMGEWVWQNNRMIPDYSPVYHHGGYFYHWDGVSYVQYGTEEFCLIDHAWDNDKAVVFVLSGFTADKDNDIPFEKTRYMVLDRSSGTVLRDSEITDIYKPNCPKNFTTNNTDVVMRLAVKGDYIYAIERNTLLNARVVRRQISENFALLSSVPLVNSLLVRASAVCVDDNAFYIHSSDTIRAYSLDLNTLLWEESVPTRTLYHSTIQAFDYQRYPGNRNFVQQSIATDGKYLYHTADDRFQVRSASTGALLFEHIFTDLPSGRFAPNSTTQINGTAGDIVVMPNYILVISGWDNSKIWAFSPKPVTKDLTGDGVVNALDVDRCVNIILGNESGYADINNDDHTDVMDMVEIIQAAHLE